MTAPRPARSGSCTVCAHSELARIELLAAGGARFAAVARKYEVGVHALRRHMKNHVSSERRAMLLLGPLDSVELADRVADEACSVIDHLRAIRCSLYGLFRAATDANDTIGGSLVAGRLHQNLSLMAKITGELASSPLVTINNNNITTLLDTREFAQFQATLIRTLGHFPEAREAVVAEFARLERAATPAVNGAAVHTLEHAEPINAD